MKEKKLVDNVGEMVEAKTVTDCLLLCDTSKDGRCLLAEWSEGEKSCKLANVVQGNGIVINDANYHIYFKLVI